MQLAGHFAPIRCIAFIAKWADNERRPPKSSRQFSTWTAVWPEHDGHRSIPLSDGARSAVCCPVRRREPAPPLVPAISEVRTVLLWWSRLLLLVKQHPAPGAWAPAIAIVESLRKDGRAPMRQQRVGRYSGVTDARPEPPDALQMGAASRSGYCDFRASGAPGFECCRQFPGRHIAAEPPATHAGEIAGKNGVAPTCGSSRPPRPIGLGSAFEWLNMRQLIGCRTCFSQKALIVRSNVFALFATSLRKRTRFGVTA